MIIDLGSEPLVRKILKDLGHCVYCVNNTLEAWMILKNSNSLCSFDYIFVSKKHEEAFVSEMRVFEECHDIVEPSKIIAY